MQKRLCYINISIPMTRTKYNLYDLFEGQWISVRFMDNIYHDNMESFLLYLLMLLYNFK